MRFDREPWRKLYIAESAEHAFMPLAVRGVRDYLLRFAAEDGTLLPATQPESMVADLAFLIRAKPNETELVSLILAELQRVGYLKFSRGRLWLPRFEEGQKARSPGAKRQAAYKARKAGGSVGDTSLETSPEASPESVTGDASGDALESVTKEEKRNEETTTTAAVVDFVLPCPSDLRLTEPQRATLEAALIPADAIASLTREFIGKSLGDPSDKRTLAVWRKCLSTAISRSWNDPRTKSRFLQAKRAESKDDTGGYGHSSEWG